MARNYGNGWASVKLTEGKPHNAVSCGCVVIKGDGKGVLE